MRFSRHNRQPLLAQICHITVRRADPSLTPSPSPSLAARLLLALSIQACRAKGLSGDRSCDSERPWLQTDRRLARPLLKSPKLRARPPCSSRIVVHAVKLRGRRGASESALGPGGMRGWRCRTLQGSRRSFPRASTSAGPRPRSKAIRRHSCHPWPLGICRKPEKRS